MRIPDFWTINSSTHFFLRPKMWSQVASGLLIVPVNFSALWAPAIGKRRVQKGSSVEVKCWGFRISWMVGRWNFLLKSSLIYILVFGGVNVQWFSSGKVSMMTSSLHFAPTGVLLLVLLAGWHQSVGWILRSCQFWRRFGAAWVQKRRALFDDIISAIGSTVSPPIK